MPEYETINKFDRAYGGLIAGNALRTKATTVEIVEKITGEAETYIVQTVRDTDGDNLVLKVMDKSGNTRLILPPKVTDTIARQRDALSVTGRRNRAKANMRERMANGFRPSIPAEFRGRRRKKDKKTAAAQ